MTHFHFPTSPLKDLPITNDLGKIFKFKGTVDNFALSKVTELRGFPVKVTS